MEKLILRIMLRIRPTKSPSSCARAIGELSHLWSTRAHHTWSLAFVHSGASHVNSRFCWWKKRYMLGISRTFRCYTSVWRRLRTPSFNFGDDASIFTFLSTATPSFSFGEEAKRHERFGVLKSVIDNYIFINKFIIEFIILILLLNLLLNLLF